MSWQRLQRDTLVDTKFLKVYSDHVKLSDGTIIDDYTVIEKHSIVAIVATDREGRLLAFEEYKYAADQMMLTLPAGQIDANETSLVAAQRELLEETGYGDGEFELVDVLNEYPTKDLHSLTIVRATNVQLKTAIQHEITEEIGELQLLTMGEVSSLIRAKKWKTTGILAALALTLPEVFRR